MAVLGAWTAVAVSGASAFAAVPSRHLAVATRMQATATSPPAAQATRDAKPVQQQQPTDKTDGSAGAAAPAAKGKRRVMHCGVCGLPKKGHFCKGPPPMSDVPIRGSVRMHHGFDRRLRQPLPEKPKPAVLEVEDVPAVPPQADARDALEDPVIQMCKLLPTLPEARRCALLSRAGVAIWCDGRRVRPHTIPLRAVHAVACCIDCGVCAPGNGCRQLLGDGWPRPRHGDHVS